MIPEDLVDSVNRIHADAGLKQKVLSGRPAVGKRQSLFSPLLKCAAGIAVMAVVVLGATIIPQILKPVGTVANSSKTQGGSASVPLAQAGVINGFFQDGAIQNILVLGVDEPQAGGRSDSILLVSIDKRHSKLKITSFLRDMYVEIPGYEKNKLSAAYQLGKAPLTVKTIEKNFGIAIDNYVTVDFNAFVKSIDRLGGVKLKITAEEARLINANSGESAGKRLAAGTGTLTGKQALYYSRIRALDSDAGRSERQRKVLASIMNQLQLNQILSSKISLMSSIVNDVFPLITTNMDKNAVLALANDSLTYLNYPVSQSCIPAEGAYKEQTVTIGGFGNCVLVPDLEKNRQIVAKFIYEDEYSKANSDINVIVD